MARISTFYLKLNDTRPTLRVVLRNPDGTVFSLAGTSGYQLHIKPADSAVITRTMTKVGIDDDGTLQYIWQESDWDDLVAGRHRMEYEVTGSDGFRVTFPNSTYDQLVISADLGPAEEE